uniref:Cytochrome c n=1 Tax=Geobacter metallireducens TaxID=28232 RepID=A0A831UBW3_GEOME
MQTKRFSPRYLYLYLTALAGLLMVPALASAVTMSVKVTTDKGSYAPGQLVKVTAYAVYSDGKPVLSTTKRQLSVKNPTGTTVFKTTLTSTGNGYYAGSYTLAAAAPAGTWEAKAEFQDPALIKASGKKTFTVTGTTPPPPADTTAPVTTPSPAGGTFTAPVSVTLSANEPATIYYTTDGTTPTTASAAYSSPITIASTATLKFFARDTAGNAEAVKSVSYTIAATPPPAGAPHANLKWNGAGTCVACHAKEATEVHASVHYQWKGATPAIANHTDGGGKSAGAMNAYCINITGNWNSCSKCHVGLGAQPTATADTAQLNNIDCLVCHQEKYKRVKVNGVMVPDTANMAITMDQAVQTLHRPTRASCLQCHATAGGGDGVKRGDLALAHGATTDRAYDVHMATTGANLTCQGCHTTSEHRISGRGSDLRPTEGAAPVGCATTACHAAKTGTGGHATAAVNTHMARVACQTCHIGTYARNAFDTPATEATEVFRDWQQPHLGATGTYHPLMQMQNDLTPVYAFWNGTSWAYNLFDVATPDPVTGYYPVSRPLGGINDPKSKLYPFKYKTASQPLATLTSQLIPVDTSVYFATGNLYNAVNSGLVNLGLTAGAPNQMVTTYEYQALNHEVMTRDKALTCTDCHGTTARMNLKQLGYTLKGAESAVCIQCHGFKPNPGFSSVHTKHVTDKKYDCSFCHTFSRPERGLRTTK